MAYYRSAMCESSMYSITAVLAATYLLYTLPPNTITPYCCTAVNNWLLRLITRKVTYQVSKFECGVGWHHEYLVLLRNINSLYLVRTHIPSGTTYRYSSMNRTTAVRYESSPEVRDATSASLFSMSSTTFGGALWAIGRSSGTAWAHGNSLKPLLRECWRRLPSDGPANAEASPDLPVKTFGSAHDRRRSATKDTEIDTSGMPGAIARGRKCIALSKAAITAQFKRRWEQ